MVIGWNISCYFSKSFAYPVAINFEIPLRCGDTLSGDTVYIGQRLSEKSEMSYCAVLVDTLAFIGYWRYSDNDDRFPNYHLSGHEKLWRNDKDFGIAARSFSGGKKKPAWLYVDPIVLNKDFRIQINSSAGHIFWLLHYGADYIPMVFSNREMAENVRNRIGRIYCPIYSLSELLQFQNSELQ